MQVTFRYHQHLYSAAWRHKLGNWWVAGNGGDGGGGKFKALRQLKSDLEIGKAETDSRLIRPV